MIIDIHAHAFPGELAKRTIQKLSVSGNARNYLDGTYESLIASMKKTGIDISVILPVVTKASHTNTVNKVALEVNELYGDSGLLSFGGIHPDNEDYKAVLKSLSDNGIKGIKLHPVYQQVPFDDIRFMNIVDYACSLGLIVLTHAGLDFSFPGNDNITPKRIRNVYDRIHPDKLILAHLGSWGLWDEVEEYIAGTDMYLDTAFANIPVRASEFAEASVNAAEPSATRPLATASPEQFERIIRSHGTDKVLFGTDTPWTSQSESLKQLHECSFTDEELNKILYLNAAKLLQL